jgi:nucleolar protein 53
VLGLRNDVVVEKSERAFLVGHLGRDNICCLGSASPGAPASTKREIFNTATSSLSQGFNSLEISRMADPLTLPPQQYSQSSRKGKKAWRKNVDITEVQAGLENLREEVIKGGPIAEKPSDELFATDTAGSDAIRTKYGIGKKLKADEILAQRSAVPSVSMRKRKADDAHWDEEWAKKVAEVKGRVTDGIVPKKQKRDHISYKEYERLRKLAYGGDTQHNDIVQVDEEGANYDPWNAPPPEHNGTGDGWLESKKPVREPATLKRNPVSLAKSGKAIPAVTKPDAGKSYNPAFTDWDALIQREGAKEVEAERARQEDARREKEIEELRAKAAREEELERVGYSSNWESEWESEWEGIMSEAEEQEWLSKKRSERKTRAERNRIARRKEEESKRMHEEKLKKRERQLEQVKALTREAEEKERGKMQLVKTQEESSEEDEEVELRSRRFGAHHVPEGPLEVVLADELQESLRLLKPEGNMLGERFRSIMVRGKVEARKKILQHKKKNGKPTEKWSYKDWKLK